MTLQSGTFSGTLLLEPEPERPGPAGRLPSPPRIRRRLLPALLVVAWLVLGGAMGPFTGRLSEIQSNDPGSFLPAGAESTVVQHLQERFTQSRLLVTVVVFDRKAGLTSADRVAIDAKAAELGRAPGLDGPASPPLPSADGQAVQVLLPVSGKDPYQAGTAVKRIRQIAESGLPNGLRALATGPGGYNADLAEVFGGIDGTLLLVTALIVAFILIIVYRSPLLPLLVLISAGLALAVSSAVIYALASAGTLTLNGQSQGILLILVFGAATDYALLLVSRYREELTRTEKASEAMRVAWRSSLEPIAASGGTVILGMLCMLASELTSNRSLGPVASIGIAGALLSSLTFLPAALALVGRAAFWPADPFPRKHRLRTNGVFDHLAKLVRIRPRWVWAGTVVVLLAGVLFVPSLKAEGTSQKDLFLTKVDAVTGQDVVTAHFPGGTGSPVVIMTRAAAAGRVLGGIKTEPGLVDLRVTPLDPRNPRAGLKTVDGFAEITATLRDPADSPAAAAVVRRLRDTVHTVAGAEAKSAGRPRSSRT